MGLSRRFLNLIVNEFTPGVTSLRNIDLRRHELFYPPPPEMLPPSALKVEPLRLSTPTFTFRACRYGCLPVADRKVLCTDRQKHAFLFDAATRHVVTIPTRREFKGMPVSVIVPRAGDGDGDPDGTLFVMEIWQPQDKQFEAFMYHRTSKSSRAKY